MTVLRRPRLLAGLLSLITGVLVAIQGRATGELALRFGNPVPAPAWNFVSSLLLLAAWGMFSAAGRQSVRQLPGALRERRLNWFDVLAGLISAYFVFAIAYAVPQIGVSLVMVGIVAGQTGNALVVDRLGLAGGDPEHLHPGRVGAALLALIGIAVATGGRGGFGDFSALPVVLVVLAGGLGAFVMASMARVNRATGHPLAAVALVNGAAALGLVVALLVGLVNGLIDWTWPSSAPWWVWIGGAISIFSAAVTAFAAHRLGILMFVLAMLTGQLVMAVVLDVTAPTAPVAIGAPVVVGVLITFASAALGAVFSRRRVTAIPSGATGGADCA